MEVDFRENNLTGMFLFLLLFRLQMLFLFLLFVGDIPDEISKYWTYLEGLYLYDNHFTGVCGRPWISCFLGMYFFRYVAYATINYMFWIRKALVQSRLGVGTSTKNTYNHG